MLILYSVTVIISVTNLLWTVRGQKRHQSLGICKLRHWHRWMSQQRCAGVVTVSINLWSMWTPRGGKCVFNAHHPISSRWQTDVVYCWHVFTHTCRSKHSHTSLLFQTHTNRQQYNLHVLTESVCQTFSSREQRTGIVSLRLNDNPTKERQDYHSTQEAHV